MDTNTRMHFRILPGETRGQDRIIRSDLVSSEIYRPSHDKSLSEDQRQYAANMLVVKVQGEDPKMYRFILPCYFDADWLTIQDYALSDGLTLVQDPPVSADDDSQIGRSIITSWVAMVDGSVHRIRRPSNSDYVYSEKLPITIEPEVVASLVCAQRAHETPQSSEHDAPRQK